MNYNLHTHTYLSHHASGTPEEYVLRAIDGGIKYMGFSDHFPWMCADGIKSTFRVDVEDASAYIGEVLRLKEKYKDKIEIHLGFEMEYYPENFSKMLENARAYGAEYLICGEHFVAEERTCPTSSALSDDESRLSDYTDAVIAAMNTGVFTYIAHPDLFNFCGDGAIYEKYMRKMCVASRECGIPLEINFLGIRTGRHYPSERFWRIAGEERSPVTFGCDAHASIDAADPASYARAMEMVEEYSLNYIGMPNIINIQ